MRSHVPAAAYDEGIGVVTTPSFILWGAMHASFPRLRWPMSVLAICALSTVTGWPLASWLSASALGTEFRYGSQTFTVPDHCLLEQVAGPPLVDRPLTFDFDERGRLYVADSSGSNAPVQQQLSAPNHRIVRLEDSDNDGVFDARTVFADHLMLPQGTLWHDQSLYVAAPPQIWRLTDTDDDGVADSREVWFDGRTLTSCANDLHGPYLGRDGWFYWCKGGFAEQVYDLPGRAQWHTRAAHIFRSRPDGTGIEPVLTGGMDNPIDVAFTARGERLLSSTFLTHPSGGLRDGLVHALYGGVYGKQHSVLDGHARTGDLLTPLVQMGPAAVCGLHAHSGAGFGEDYCGDLFACAFNLRKVSRHHLVPQGSTFLSSESDFLESDSADFHPTDVIEDADGSLLVADTGGWYKLCCPTSHIEKPANLGAIYRIRRKDAVALADPRGLAIDWKGLVASHVVALLSDPRPAVVARAVTEIAQRKVACLAAVAQLLNVGENNAGAGTAGEPSSRREAIWALSRIEHPDARALVRRALADPDPAVQQVAAHVSGLHRDAAALEGLLLLLAHKDHGVARAAAEAIGRLGNPVACRALLDASARLADRSLQHSLTYALIEIGNPQIILETLPSFRQLKKNGSTRAAILALDQMALRLPQFVLDRDEVIRLCAEDDPALCETAWWIASQHPEWSDSLVPQVQPLLARAASGDAKEKNRIVQLLARIASQRGIAAALAAALDQPDNNGPNRSNADLNDTRSITLLVLQAAAAHETPSEWIAVLERLLVAESSTPDGELLQEVLTTLSALSLTQQQRLRLQSALDVLAENPAASSRVCLQCLRITADSRGALPAALVSRLTAIALAEESPLDRSAAASLLAGQVLPAAAWQKIVTTFDRMRSLEIGLLLPAVIRAGGPAVEQAIDVLERRNDLLVIRDDGLTTAVQALPTAVALRVELLLARAAATVIGDHQRLKELAASLPPGNASRGHAVFSGRKSACLTCHAMAFVGGQVGPDLSTIGRIRTAADLLEAIVLPSSSFVRSYESSIVITADGRSASGIIKDAGAEEIVLQTGPTAVERFARDAIESITTSPVSLMPKGYDTLLSPQELSDLVAFLSANR